ncbi:MAG: hypothetical protein IJA50_02845 [Firmicutes bacterium]|nr:hypothetical protein [Bacillota bacterium]MBR2619944.1 hypothetical protein [Bacillota bacterium]MBR3787475.1 hypothetical protein [Bacillota bacterium]MBR6799098.1 hypothetical protein [Bacillota bacterium]
MAVKRLANMKTRKETGLDFVVSAINLQTPFGVKQIKEQEPFLPGEEEDLREELKRVQKMMDIAGAAPKDIGLLLETFMVMKDNTFSIERAKSSVLSVVEIFELKSLLLQMLKVRTLADKLDFPKEFVPEDTEALLDVLDPGGDRLNTFYIYDSFSEKLEQLRREKKEKEREIRKQQKVGKELVKQKYGLSLTPKFEMVVSKSDRQSIKMIDEISEMTRTDEDYMSVTFSLTATEEVENLMKVCDQLMTAIEDEELNVREKLSEEISKYEAVLLENCRRIGELDITLSKALYAEKHNCVMPEIADEHILEFEDGRNLQLEEALLARKGGEYCPVSMALTDGVTCITGANMGGKTISLKLAGMVAILTQYGFFVPCKSARVGLSNYMQILIGDSQSIERGLSSFGSEMEELKEILDNSKDRSLLLIDEIASGTNPVEGLALTRSLVDHIKDQPYITLMTTHFETVTEDKDVKNLQVMGLAGADFDKLDKELRYAKKKDRINIISKYMDYRLRVVDDAAQIPKDALNIAKMLGIDKSIIEKAKDYIK